MSVEYFDANDPRVFVFDLEFLGDVASPHSTRIYSIAVVHAATGRQFSKIVDPQASHTELQQFRTYAGCRQVTKKWLRKQKAVPLATAFRAMRQFVDKNILFRHAASSKTRTLFLQNPIFIAHACFRADLPVLKSALCRCRVASLPFHWRFFDSLWFFRTVLPKTTNQKYSLFDVATTLNVEICQGNMHDALPDALLLLKCLNKFHRLQGSLYSWWQTPLTTVPGIGAASEMKLFQSNVHSKESLLSTIAMVSHYTIVSLPEARWNAARYLNYVGIKHADAVVDHCMNILYATRQNK